MKYYSLSDYTKEQVLAAQKVVADGRINLYHAIREENAYAPHVTENQKDEHLAKGLIYAEEIREGKHNGNLTVLQLLLLELSGKCIPLLS